MFFKKCQISLEYLLVLAVVLAVLLTVYFVIYDRIYEEDDVFEFKQAKDSVKEMAIAAEEIYYRGPPSKTTLRLRLPKSTDQISVEDAGTGYYVLKIRIYLSPGTAIISYPTRARMETNFPAFYERKPIDYVNLQAKRTSSGEVFVEICGANACGP